MRTAIPCMNPERRPQLCHDGRETVRNQALSLNASYRVSWRLALDVHKIPVTEYCDINRPFREEDVYEDHGHQDAQVLR